MHNREIEGMGDGAHKALDQGLELINLAVLEAMINLDRHLRVLFLVRVRKGRHRHTCLNGTNGIKLAMEILTGNTRSDEMERAGLRNKSEGVCRHPKQNIFEIDKIMIS